MANTPAAAKSAVKPQPFANGYHGCSVIFSVIKGEIADFFRGDLSRELATWHCSDLAATLWRTYSG
jgi:hypothetical protein